MKASKKEIINLLKFVQSSTESDTSIKGIASELLEELKDSGESVSLIDKNQYSAAILLNRKSIKDIIEDRSSFDDDIGNLNDSQKESLLLDSEEKTDWQGVQQMLIEYSNELLTDSIDYALYGDEQ